MGRNACGLALLVTLALGGCSNMPSWVPLKGQKEAKAAEAKAAALRVRTDSLRKARHAADSVAQVRFAACVDSVRAELVKPPVVVKKAKAKSKRKQPKPPAPSEELIMVQAQSACGSDTHVPTTKLAVDSAAQRAPIKTPIALDSVAPKIAVATKAVPTADSAKAPAMAPAKDTVIRTSAPAPVVDQAMAVDSLQKARETEMTRETFAYSGSTRDPFMSLLNVAKSGPEVADLQLVGIYQNMRSPSASVAVFREKEGGRRHKLRAGDQLGRSRVVQIRERDVVFMIEDFGFERQETLSLRKQEDVTP
ncbi:MAG TPA: hypothetical protein VFY42_04680 [Gemmatimonadales bacterium]|nr:hypothetical protein [Gemmatimonadales bacterium]